MKEAKNSKSKNEVTKQTRTDRNEEFQLSNEFAFKIARSRSAQVAKEKSSFKSKETEV